MRIEFATMIVERLDDPSGLERAAAPLEGALALARRQKMLISRPWPGFGEPFNGQAARTRAIDLLLSEFAPGAVIETGTFLGFTTRWLAEKGVDTYTVEVSPRFRAAGRYALRDLENVTMIWGDSAAAMRHLAAGSRISKPFAYLDAHWEDDLPLNDELDCLLSTWDDALVAIDDFHVPGEPGYGYDVYNGVPLSLEQLSLPESATVAFPATPALEETGSRRGAVYIGQGEAASQALMAAQRGGLVAVQREGEPSSASL
jgi:predicted O-methyltransferase YrrM